MSYPEYSYKVLIREGHLDTFGHVNNATYLQLAEDARWEMLVSAGYGLDVVQRTQQGPTILTAEVLFKRELCLREDVTIVTQLRSYHGKVAVLGQKFLKAGGTVATELTFKVGLFDLSLRKLILPTPEWRSALGVAE
jgi:YbgC/YbaW family acyl-CoA thioester hydrolase